MDTNYQLLFSQKNYDFIKAKLLNFLIIDFTLDYFNFKHLSKASTIKKLYERSIL